MYIRHYLNYILINSSLYATDTAQHHRRLVITVCNGETTRLQEREEQLETTETALGPRGLMQ